MKNTDKTKEQLFKEIDQLRVKIAEQEKSKSMRNKAEDISRESEQFMKSLFESVQDGISVLKPDLTIRHVNGIMNKWYKANLPLEGKKCYEVYHNADKPCDPCPSLRCLESGKTELNVVPGLPGSPVEWIELFSYPIKDPDSDKIIGVVEYVRDITVRKQAEKKLIESEQKFRDMANLLPQIVYEIDLYGNLTFVNKQAFESFRYSQEEFEKGINVFQTLIPEDIDRAKENMQNILHGKEIGSPEYTALRKDGSTFPILIYASAIIKDNKPVGLRGIIVDITERKQAEEELKKHREQLEELVKERTQKLEEQNKELERLNHLFVNREFRIKELRDRVKELEGKISDI